MGGHEIARGGICKFCGNAFELKVAVAIKPSHHCETVCGGVAIRVDRKYRCSRVNRGGWKSVQKQ